jgi:hypothetical protein
MTDPLKPLPDVHDPLTAPFWAATRESRLVLPRCRICGYVCWPPEPVCPQCLDSSWEWVDVAARGQLWSYATYHRALDPAFAADVPYAVGLIELDAGRKMYGIMTGDIERLQIGAPVRGVFRAVNDEVTFVDWRIDEDA